MALAVPAGGGVQRAFGTDAKSLQVGFAADAGVRAARLAAAGATADLTALDAWFGLLGGDPSAVPGWDAPAVPGGLAIKIFPCCYALQRPISAVAALAGRERIDPAAVDRIVVRTLKGTVTPLIHHRPETGLQGKFSLEYAVAAALLDDNQGFATFTEAAVRRPVAQRLARRVEVQLTDGGDALLAGEFEAEIHLGDRVLHGRERFPPGSPQRPPSHEQLMRKVADCLAGTTVSPEAIDWSSAPVILRTYI
jgi:2-methylcitrate dehydratase PrpD